MNEVKLDPKSLPKNGQRVKWVNDGKLFEGTYIESEEMFHIGFQDRGDFHYARHIDFWVEEDKVLEGYGKPIRE
jgi:hypothetical protein